MGTLGKVGFVLGLLVTLLASVSATAAGQALDDTAKVLIQRAGNAYDDAERLRLLKELRDRPDLEPGLRADAEKLIEFVGQWVDATNLHFYSAPVYGNQDYDFRIAKDSPLYPLTYLYRGRMVLTCVMQSGNIWSFPDRRGEWFATARGFFQKAHEAYPENRIVRMYLGEPLPWERNWPEATNAPEWAVNQRLGLEAIADIVEWWIDNRQQEHGPFGGGWGDDCEMWRWWTPVLIAFEDKKIVAAQAKFSEALMSQPHMMAGYMDRMTDVEHSAEDSTDVILPMMHLASDEEVWKNRAVRLGELMRDVWTGRNERGFLQFKSTYFTATDVHPDAQKACDTPYHVRAIQPALLYWQRTGDPMLTELFTEWMYTWVEATTRQENGKPVGIIPAALHWPKGTVGGLSRDWWDPRNHGEPTLYQWPSAMGGMTDTLLLAYHMTDEEGFLEPIRSMARIWLDYLKNPSEGKPGSLAWCGAKMSFLSSAITKYRLLTGDDQFDALIGGGRSPYLDLLRTGDRESFDAALASNAKAFRQNVERYTSEVRYTDRVLRFPAVLSGNVKLAEPKFEVHSPNPALLYSSATGDPGAIGYFPMNAVRWLTPPRKIAALVTNTGPHEFAAELYHFGRQSRAMAAEFYLLAPGDYRLAVRTKGAGKVLQTEAFTVTGGRTTVEFSLPSRELCVVEARAR